MKVVLKPLKYTLQNSRMSSGIETYLKYFQPDLEIMYELCSYKIAHHQLQLEPIPWISKPPVIQGQISDKVINRLAIEVRNNIRDNLIDVYADTITVNMPTISTLIFYDKT